MLCALVLCTALATDGGAAATPSADDLAAYQDARSKVGRDADAQVKLALWCEARGLKAERLRHLAAAILTDPSHAAARGLMGLVAYGGRWERPEAVGEKVRADAELAAKLAEYNARRDANADTADGHWHLASWCEREGLAPEAAAHFGTVVRLDPARDAAWRKLGFINKDGRWTTEARLAAERAEARSQRQGDARWRGRLEWYRDKLGNPRTRGEAEAALAKVEDPYAVPSAWAVFGAGDAAGQTVAVQVLGQIATPRSSRALATLAAFSPSAAVRRAASEVLALRDVREYGGYLLDMARDPVRYKAGTVAGADGQVRRTLLIEGARFNIQEVFDRPIAAVSTAMALLDPEGFAAARAATNNPAGMGLGTVLGADVAFAPAVSGRRGGAARDSAPFRENAQFADQLARIESYNGQVALTNDGAYGAMNQITGAALGQDRPAWARWYADRLGYAITTPPAQNTEFKPTLFVSVNAPSHSCFAAGTPVQTLTGTRPIEALKVGDRVLTQEAGSGGISYQPVVAVYHNPPNATLRVVLEEESVVATGIHRFWKAGKGWTMARDLKPGDVVRTLGGRSRVLAVEAASVQPVFNLEVARGQSFFVGRGVLVHDNSVINPTPDPFDAEPVLIAAKGR